MNFDQMKSDEFSKALIENPDLLLTPNINENESSIDFFSLIQNENVLDQEKQSEIHKIEQQTSIERNLILSQESNCIQQQNQTSESKEDEIIDFNLFEMLRSEDPEVDTLLELIGNNVDFPVTYLPQISINTTNKLLENFNSDYMQQNNSIENYSNETKRLNKNESFTDLSDLLNINSNNKMQIVKLKTEEEAEEEKKIEPTRQASTRVSLRLVKKKDTPKLQEYKKELEKKSLRRINNKSRILNLKRKRSVDEDEDEIMNSSLNSNENSIDNSSISGGNGNHLSSNNSVGSGSDEHIYYDDDEEDEDEDDNESFDMNRSVKKPRSFEIDDENSNERDFRLFVRNYNQINKLGNHKVIRGMREIDPTKKESNKEAATRYRLKKLSEKDQLFETRMHLEKENSDVKRRIEFVQTEINYLKNLLVHMILTRGVLSNAVA